MKTKQSLSIPIPFSPVPITGQTIGVVLVGGLLGAAPALIDANQTKRVVVRQNWRFAAHGVTLGMSVE